ncbi:MAG: patatin-like phospholipase family protein [Acidobacteria bacterium]|nr:patatin-like phospholipase family protein [Acidobacteriota bacterium]
MRRGLILGGGGFFGAFQAGAYEQLGEFDCVAGTSAGALNAWAIASAMPPGALQELWLRAAGTARAGLHFPRYWGDGFLNARILEAMVRSMVRDWQPRVDLGIVVSQGRALRPVLLRNEEITADVLLASCAVPFVLPGKRIGGNLSLDGGLRDACPVWAPREMGADEIIAINVWTHLPRWWPGGRVRAGRAQAGVTLIEPPRALGPIRRSILATPGEVASWIELGRHTAKTIFARQ